MSINGGGGGGVSSFSSSAKTFGAVRIKPAISRSKYFFIGCNFIRLVFTKLQFMIQDKEKIGAKNLPQPFCIMLIISNLYN
jgi:hypothetical protein